MTQWTWISVKKRSNYYGVLRSAPIRSAKWYSWWRELPRWPPAQRRTACTVQNTRPAPPFAQRDCSPGGVAPGSARRAAMVARHGAAHCAALRPIALARSPRPPRQVRPVHAHRHHRRPKGRTPRASPTGHSPWQRRPQPAHQHGCSTRCAKTVHRALISSSISHDRQEPKAQLFRRSTLTVV